MLTATGSSSSSRRRRKITSITRYYVLAGRDMSRTQGRAGAPPSSIILATFFLLLTSAGSGRSGDHAPSDFELCKGVVPTSHVGRGSRIRGCSQLGPGEVLCFPQRHRTLGGSTICAAGSGAGPSSDTDSSSRTYSNEILEWLSKPVTVDRSQPMSMPVASETPAPVLALGKTFRARLEQTGAIEASGAAVLGRAEGMRGNMTFALAPTTGHLPVPGYGRRSFTSDLLLLVAGMAVASCLHLITRLIRENDQPPSTEPRETSFSSKGEPVEWVNMCWRKLWRVYQRGLERWIVDLLQPVFDSLLPDVTPESFRRLKILEFTLDHDAPTFSNMRRRNSRKDSDLSGVVDCRYTGGAKMLLQIELGMGNFESVKIPVMVSNLDFQGKLWIKLRLAPMCPWIGTIFLAFVGKPKIQVQLSPYNRVPLMRVPILQKILTKLLIEDLPGLMVLPEKLEIVIPPALTSVAEAAVGRDAIMQAVAQAVLQADTRDASLASALPLGPQSAAGGISLPDSFVGEALVVLREGRNLPVWGTSIQSNPWCRVVLGEQAWLSKRNKETSTRSNHRNPVWNQETQFLVQDPSTAVLEFYVKDSHLTGRTSVGQARLPLITLPEDRVVSMWIPVESEASQGPSEGEILIEICYKPFEDDIERDGESTDAYGTFKEEGTDLHARITDIKSAADASSRANVAQSAAMAAVAVTKAAAARAATRAAQAAQAAGATTANTTAAVANQLSRVRGGKNKDGPSGDDNRSPRSHGSAPPDSQESALQREAAVLRDVPVNGTEYPQGNTPSRQEEDALKAKTTVATMYSMDEAESVGSADSEAERVARASLQRAGMELDAYEQRKKERPSLAWLILALAAAAGVVIAAVKTNFFGI